MPKIILPARTGIVLSAAHASLLMLAASINTAVGQKASTPVTVVNPDVPVTVINPVPTESADGSQPALCARRGTSKISTAPLAFGVLAFFLAAAEAAEAPRYAFSTINVPDADSTVARGINDAGQIVGYFSDGSGTHAFLLSDGNYTAIDVPNASTQGRGINTAGQVIGYFTDSKGTHGFLYSGGKFTTIDAPDARFGTFAIGINDAGYVVGDFFVTQGQQHGFVYTGEQFMTIDFPGANSGTAATGINNAFQIVGYYDVKQGFLLDHGEFTTVDFPGSHYTFPFGINGAGQIVGFYGARYCEPKRPTHGFLAHGGKFITIDVPNAAQTCAYGINNKGQIVGLYSDGAITHGFLATPENPAEE